MDPHGKKFHDLAGRFLLDLGFKLADNPTKARNPYQATGAIYRADNGMYLAVGFNPLDGNSALIMCGRRWRTEDGWSTYSNHYATLAKLFGYDLPLSYQLGYGETDVTSPMKKMLEDLQLSLPTVLDQVTFDDILRIEGDAFGARQHATSWFGSNYSEFVIIDGIRVT